MSMLSLLLYAWFSLAQNPPDRSIVKQSAAGAPKAPQGTLIVSNRPAARGDEGYVVYFIIRSANGSRVDELSLGGGSRAYLMFSLSSGPVYDLVSYVRDCNGNCGSLDPPEDECRAQFTLKANETLYAKRVRIAPRRMSGPRCEFVFSPQP
jgi:hypothetical protein